MRSLGSTNLSKPGTQTSSAYLHQSSGGCVRFVFRRYGRTHSEIIEPQDVHALHNLFEAAVRNMRIGPEGSAG